MIYPPGMDIQAPATGAGRSTEMVHEVYRRLAALAAREHGMSTVEYAIGTIAAAAFAAVLYTVVTGGSVASALTSIIQRALSVTI